MTIPVPSPDLDLQLEREVNVPPEAVWAAWTQPDQLVKWFTPAPWTTAECQIDLRPGGMFRTVMRSPEGEDFPNVGCYLEVVPYERLVWTSALAPGYRPLTQHPPGSFPFTAAITLERLWTLRGQRVVPEELVDKVWRWVENRTLSDKQIFALQQHSPLGRVLAAGLANRHRDRSLMIEAIEDAGRHVAHELERYLNALGTIAAISPLLGLLGTVTGMIRTFKAITVAGVGNPSAMASGIAEALITTATGLIIAIPALVAYRMLRSRVDGHVIDMEKESLKLVQAIDRASVLRPASAAGIGAALSSPTDAQEAVA